MDKRVRYIFVGIAMLAFVIGGIFAYLAYEAPEVVFADTEGANNTGTSANQTGTCSDNMNFSGHGTPGNAAANDTSYVSYGGNNWDTQISDGLDFSNFSFSTSGTIDGIQVEIINWMTAETANYTDVVLFTSPGTRVGDDKGTGSVPTSDPASTYDSFGGSADTWGAGLTSTQVNSSNFGVTFCYTSLANNSKIIIDHVQITVTFTPSAGGGQINQSIIWYD